MAVAADLPAGIEISSDLRQSMKEAGTYDELSSCWQHLADEVDLKADTQYGSFLYWLELAHRCFTKAQHPACDSGVKGVFESEEYLSKLDKMGIPREFLLQSVRVGALMNQLYFIQGDNRHNPVQNFVDADGYSWADGQLIVLSRDKEAARGEQAAAEAAAARTREKVKKETTIADIQLHMREPDFSLTRDQADLLRSDFKGKLRYWKAFCDACMSSDTVRPFVFGEYADEEITPEIFAAFREAYEGDPHLADRYDKLPLEIIDPESGWFYVLIKNKKTTMSRFLSAAVSNMNSWFEL
ncbi:hypothetical protein KJ742_00885 [Patescibacteria group bacterium]|nr:hypothetical protein [Patescibacteria group bacterium]MBU1682478.1 hypothetical protein [Patescibacteria group bacterium]MBU1935488.1 hypothetical protein [Patescibacteria group bacterium]